MHIFNSICAYLRVLLFEFINLRGLFNINAIIVKLKKQVKLATLVEGFPNASFSIVTTPIIRGRCYSILLIAQPYPCPYLILLSVKQGRIKYYFLSIWYESTCD